MTFKIRKITLALICAAALFLFGTVTVFAGNTLAESNSNSEGYILGDGGMIFRNMPQMLTVTVKLSLKTL